MSKYAASEWPTATVLSKTVMATFVRLAMFRECLESGEDTQQIRSSPSGAKNTGVTHGVPKASAVPSTQYRFSDNMRAMVARSFILRCPLWQVSGCGLRAGASLENARRVRALRADACSRGVPT